MTIKMDQRRMLAHQREMQHKKRQHLLQQQQMEQQLQQQQQQQLLLQQQQPREQQQLLLQPQQQTEHKKLLQDLLQLSQTQQKDMGSRNNYYSSNSKQLQPPLPLLLQPQPQYNLPPLQAISLQHSQPLLPSTTTTTTITTTNTTSHPRPRSQSFSGVASPGPSIAAQLRLPGSFVFNDKDDEGQSANYTSSFYTSSNATTSVVGNTVSGSRTFSRSFLSSVVDFATRPLAMVATITPASPLSLVTTTATTAPPPHPLIIPVNVNSSSHIIASASSNSVHRLNDDPPGLGTRASDPAAVATDHDRRLEMVSPATTTRNSDSSHGGSHISDDSHQLALDSTGKYNSIINTSDTDTDCAMSPSSNALSTPPRCSASPFPPPPPPLPTAEALVNIKQVFTGVINGEQCEIHPESGLPYASADKNDEFHKLFGQYIPRGERLISEFVCALNCGILVDGKMWISEDHICFRGWTSKPVVVLDFFSVVHIEKRNWAGVVPNAIEVETATNKYFFGTVWPPRNPKYDLLVQIWNAHVDATCLLRKVPDITSLSCACFDAAEDTENHTGICDVCMKRDQLTCKSGTPSSTSGSLSVPKSIRISRSNNSLDRSKGRRRPSNESPISGPTSAESLREISNTRPLIPPSSSDIPNSMPPWPENRSHLNPLVTGLSSTDTTAPSSPQISRPEPTGPVICPCLSKSTNSFIDDGFTVVLDTTIALSIESLWTQWLNYPQKRNLYSRYLPEKRGFRDLQFGPWVSCNTQESNMLPLEDITDFSEYDRSLSSISPGFHRRTQYIVPLSAPIGPKQTRSINTQSILSHKLGHYLCEEVHNHSPDVSTTFYNIGRTCFSFVSPGTTRVRVYWKVVFTKSYLTRVLIERITIDQMKSFFVDFSEYINANIDAVKADEASALEKSGVLVPKDGVQPSLTHAGNQDRPGDGVCTDAKDKSSGVVVTGARRDLTSPTPLSYRDKSTMNATHSHQPHPASQISPSVFLILIVLLVFMAMMNTVTLMYIFRLLDRTDRQLMYLQRGWTTQGATGI
ncbi:hypothetical protein BASA50_000118 [Batrachochytrium salamandrivorans]|uniref:VASt domain-containing protein n=1 Tax=Batrachochytrium salamandrivorans TaxID=1357716 RepID=A0ABQ8EV26_9FUNG|nr:hypothetical protein BASA50_000118 [Batrachochytrium salamandrivorans]